jgi:hypothetical protein
MTPNATSQLITADAMTTHQYRLMTIRINSTTARIEWLSTVPQDGRNVQAACRERKLGLSPRNHLASQARARDGPPSVTTPIRSIRSISGHASSWARQFVDGGQPHRLLPERDRPVVAIDGTMMQRDVDCHGTDLGRRLREQRKSTAPDNESPARHAMIVPSGMQIAAVPAAGRAARS